MHPLQRFIMGHDMSIQEFIDRYKPGLSRSFISDVCHGKRNLSKNSALKISQATGIPAEVLIFPEAAHKYTSAHPRFHPLPPHKAKDCTVCKCMQRQ